MAIYVVVQCYPWFKFYFVLNSLSYTIQCPKTKGNKILTKDKIEPQHNYTSIYKSASDYNFSTIHWINHHIHPVDNEPIVLSTDG